MGNIANWLNDRYNTKYVDKVVEDTHAQLKDEDPLLNETFPLMEYDDRNWLGMTVSKIKPIASIIGYGGKVPTTDHNDFRQAVTQMEKLGLESVFDDELQHRMQEILRYARSSNLQDKIDSNGNLVKGLNNSLADMIFQQPKDLVVGIHNLLAVFAWSIKTSGQINFTDDRTNLRSSISWLDENATYNHFPSALTNTGSGQPLGSVVWNDYDNADGIATIIDDIITYEETNGFYPKKVILSSPLARDLSFQKKVIDRAKGYQLFQNATSVGLATINSILKDHIGEDVTIEKYDRRYDKKDLNTGKYLPTRFLSTNRYVFVRPKMGERCLGPTTESKKDLYDTPKTGIFVKTKEDPIDESRDICTAKATGLSICLNPKLLFSRQVRA